MILTGGDITKRDDVYWGFTPREVLPYIEYREREILFREGVLAFFGVGGNTGKAAVRRDQGLGEYCGGSDLEECRKYFGEEVLARVCATCPH